LDFPDFGGIVPGRGIEPDGRPPSFMSGSARGSGRFDPGGGGGDGSGRDGVTSLVGAGFFCVAGALLDGTLATDSSASAFPQEVHAAVPSAEKVSQRPQTIPISGSKGRGELTKSQ
jgi:hypothetical protein